MSAGGRVVRRIDTQDCPRFCAFTPAGSIDTVKVIDATPGPRLVTPTVTLPDAGCVCGACLAHAAAPAITNTAMDRRRFRLAEGIGMLLMIIGSCLERVREQENLLLTEQLAREVQRGR